MLTGTDNKKEFVLEVHRRLTEVYGSEIKYFHDLDPLSELVSSLLSHRTKNSNSAKAFAQLVNTYGTWEQVRDARTIDIQEAINACTWPEQKAPRLQNILKMITEQRGALTLDFLAELEVSEARNWLEKLPGVGPKTSAAVLSFSILRAKALPVDSHHFRVAVRLGIIEEKIGEAKAHSVLENLLPTYFTAQDVYDNHQVMMKHGKKICFYQRPDCKNCTLLDICPTGKINLSST